MLAKLAEQNIERVQIDEPILALEIDDSYRSALKTSLDKLSGQGFKILLASYFDSMANYDQDIASYLVEGIQFDCVTV